MATEFPNIDFKFRRGTKEGYSSTSYLEGSLNFVKDDEALYVHKDGITFRISDIVLDAGTEAQIRSIVLPKAKIYFAEDTHRLMWFNKATLEWSYITVQHSDEAERAIGDRNGNVINEYYYPRSEALADHEDIMSFIDSITEDISLIIQYKTVVCDSVADLPEVGEKGTIYLVPKLSYYGWDTLPAEDIMDVYVELIFIESEDYGNFYEVIGSTVVKMDNYYTKDEVDSIINSFKQEMNSEYQTFKNYMMSELNGLRSYVNGLNSNISNEIAAINNRLNTITSSITTHEQKITNLETRVSDLEAIVDGGSGSSSISERLTNLEDGLTNLSGTVDDNKSSADSSIVNINNSISTISSNVNSLIQRVTNTESDVLDHETRIDALEEGSGGSLANRVTVLENKFDTAETTINDIRDNYAVSEQGSEDYPDDEGN